MEELLSEFGTAVISAVVGVFVIGVIWLVVDNLEILNQLNIECLV